MRVQVGIFVVALWISLAVFLIGGQLGFFLAARWAASLVVVIGLLLSLIPVMAQNAVNIRELVKQIAVWLGILTLLPLAVWYGTSAFSPPPNWKQYSKSTSRLDEKLRDANEESAKDKLRQEKDQLEKELDEEERVYYHAMFWVAYPAGLVAIIVGIFFPVQAVGSGLMFGGLISLMAGCYSYWDRMGDWLRFGSLLLALAVLLALGTWRFRPLRSESTSIVG